MGRERVPLSRLDLTRDPEDLIVEPLDALAASMESGVQQYPLVDENYKVIDGRRQIEVMKHWGWDDTPVVVSREFDFSIKVLHRRHHPGGLSAGICRPITIRRLVQLHRSLRAQAHIRAIAQRSASSRARKEGGEFKRVVQGRIALSEAVGLNEAVYTRAVAQYTVLDSLPEGEEKDFLHELLAQVERGETTIFRVQTAHEKWVKIRDQGIRAGSLPEQRATLRNALAMLEGLVPAVQPIGRHLDPGWDVAELEAIADQLDNHRTALRTLSNSIRRKLT